MTVTRALQRDTQRDTRRHAFVAATELDTTRLILISTSLVALLAVALAYEGRVRRQPLGTVVPATVVNLSAATTASALETVLEPALSAPADRRFAANELLSFLAASRQAGEELPNVGAILRATVPAAAIDRTPGLMVYAERLQRAREAQKTRGAAGPDRLNLFTSADLVLIKPGLSVRTAGEFRGLLLWWGGLFIASFYAVMLLWWLTKREGDVVLLSAAHLLTALGLSALVSRADPLRDGLLFVRYVEGVLIGLVFLAGFSLVDLRKSAWLRLRYLPLAAAFMLSLALILFGDGPGTSGAKVNLGPVQPIEAIRLLLALFLAGYFARAWELLRQVNEKELLPARAPSWVRIPRVGYVVPLLGGVGLALLFFFVQKDLGPALMLSCVFLALYAVARGGGAAAAAGTALLVAGFYVGYRLHISETLAARVAMWQAPWDNAVRGGDQVAQSVWALATGGMFGTGFGLGETRYLPAGHTDLALAALGEELGLMGLAAVGALYAAITWRGFRAAMSAANDYGFFLGTAVTLFLVVPVLLMAAGLLGVVPLTGVVTPFLSYGGSAMAANFAALGILISIGAHRGGREGAEPFRMPMRYLSRGLAFAALVLLGVLLDVQLVRADRYVVRPHLSLQADGVARYQYNPRVIDLVRALPRGSVFDRAGRVLATGDPELARQARTTFQKYGVTPNGTCVEPVARCYPLGGAGFHLLGDAASRQNWSASNSSYVERDADARLRGFDDHAAAVQSTDEEGRPVPTVRRDYQALVPLLRHRHQPDSDSATEFLERNRDVRTTIDGRLQLRVSQLLANASKRSESGHAAAVVLDAATGEVLALGSYPFPVVDRPVKAAVDGRDDELLDRSRYGLYPPGSTFKLVTAAAALRQNPALSAQSFTCSDLPDGRVGVRIPGGRPVRDDVLDHHAHGTIAMHDAIVHSCNAYFAQLAMKLGPEALLDAAATLGISVTPAGSLDRLRSTLPQAGYGQGDVVATPLRMARVAAALANGGVLNETHVEMRDETKIKRERLLSPGAAATLGRYMRDGVLEGTGRTLRSHPLRVAGKTGTAEVVGKTSHSWFVGFAPYDAPPGARRIAFAVIVENAGYGGSAAASTAGDIVTAAGTAGLIK